MRTLTNVFCSADGSGATNVGAVSAAHQPDLVARYKPDIEDAIRTVAAAGGVAVVAHPWGLKGHVTEESPRWPLVL